MASSLYKNHLIVASTDYFAGASEWKAWVSISWRDNGRQHLHTINFTTERFDTLAGAKRFATQSAQQWVDKRLGIRSPKKSMELRGHPLMSYRGVSNWPPVWARWTASTDHKTVHGEIGVLKEVIYAPSDIFCRCHLIIEHRKELYVAALLFDDAAFCRLLVKALRKRLGWRVKAIGDLDLSWAL